MRKFRIYLVFVALSLAALSCNVFAGAVNGQSMLWQDDFNWKLAIDESVSGVCKEFPASVNDIGLSLREDVLVLEANTQEKGGLFVNAIAYKGFAFVDGGRYILEGSFMVPSNAKVEIADAAIEVVSGFTGHYAEVIYGLNPYVPEYGWIYTRSSDFKTVPLFYIGGNDGRWHTFKVVATIDLANGVSEITSISIDGQSKEVGIPMVAVQKPWPTAANVLLETHNQYTNCDPSVVFHGVSMWDNVTLTRENLWP
jgi:hypothetical protein